VPTPSYPPDHNSLLAPGSAIPQNMLPTARSNLSGYCCPVPYFPAPGPGEQIACVGLRWAPNQPRQLLDCAASCRLREARPRFKPNSKTVTAPTGRGNWRREAHSETARTGNRATIFPARLRQLLGLPLFPIEYQGIYFVRFDAGYTNN